MSTTRKIVIGVGLASGALLAAWLLTGSRKEKTKAFVAKGANSLLISGAMISASVALVAQSGNPAKAAAMLRTIADRIDPPTMILVRYDHMTFQVAQKPCRGPSL